MTRSSATEAADGSAEPSRAWVDAHAERFRALNVRANRASWESAVTGSEEALEESAAARVALRRLYADPAAAARVKELLSAGGERDPLLRRQLVLLDHAFTANQLPAETIQDLTRREAELERIFYTFRPRLEGKEVSNNELLDILRTEPDSGRRREAWEASKLVGREAAEPLRELIRRRNDAARSLGFEDYYRMELALQEIDEDYLFRLLDEFRRGTDDAFAALREEMDRSLAARYGVEPAEVRPWHWEDFFGQEAPSIGTVELDPIFRGRDLVAIASRYFDALGLPVDDVLGRSDLYERPGKDQHAFCTDIDRQGDVRILCNLRENEKWMATLLHELGHAVYDKFIPRSLPYLLRIPAHTLTTESIAMYFGRSTRDPAWLRGVMGAEMDEDAAADIRTQQRMAMLVSARWILVMSYFERELYRDPDRPDLNAFWWSLVEDIQRVRRPEGREEPDWAAKVHLSLAPVYYHNYLLGELMASQLAGTIRDRLGPDESPIGSPLVGQYLRREIFERGASLPWDRLVAEATGEELSPRYFVREFV